MPDPQPHHHLMSFGDHLDELRRRLILALLGPLPIFILCLVFGSTLLTFITAPLLEQLRLAGEPPTLIATSPLESFNSYLKVASIVTLITAMPWILFQAWLFIAPGLYAAERRFVYFLLPLSAGLAATAMVFLYKLVLPLSLYFLIAFGSGLVNQGVRPAPPAEGVVIPALPQFQGDPTAEAAPPGSMWLNRDLNQLRFRLDDGGVVGVALVRGGAIAQQYRIGEYVNLVFGLALVFALSFQVPVVLMLLSWVGVIEPGDLTPYRRHILFGCVLLAAIFPSQDPWTLMMLSVALYALFELGLGLMRFVPASRIATGLSIAERLDRFRAQGVRESAESEA